MFRLLGLHPGPDITAPAAASLAGVAAPRPARRWRELARANLLTEHTPGRYAFHDLLRAYAAEQATAPGQRPTTAGGHRAGCSTTTCTPRTRPHASAQRPAAGYDPAWPAPAGRDAGGLDGRGAAMAWFRPSTRCCSRSSRWRPRPGSTRTRGSCPGPWRTSCTGRADGTTGLAIQAHRAGRRAAPRRTRAAQARRAPLLGNGRVRQGSWDDAHSHQHQALDLYRPLGDQVGQARMPHTVSATVLDSRPPPPGARPRSARHWTCTGRPGATPRPGPRPQRRSAGTARCSATTIWHWHPEPGGPGPAAGTRRPSGEAEIWTVSATPTTTSASTAGHRAATSRAAQPLRGDRRPLRTGRHPHPPRRPAQRRRRSGRRAATPGEARRLFEELHHPDAEQVGHKLSRATAPVSSLTYGPARRPNCAPDSIIG